MSRYAPVNAEGLKPWVVTTSEWGRKHDRVVYAETARQACYQTIGRAQHVSATARRATPADVEPPDLMKALKASLDTAKAKP